MRGPQQPMRGRRGSPPMREEGRGGFPPPPPMLPDGRRRRSPSPQFRRSPPPKRYRRDEDFDRFGPSGPASFDEGPHGYDRRGPPPPPPYGRSRYDDRMDDRHPDAAFGRRGSPGPRRPAGPKAFKHYLLDLPDEVTPQDAQQSYDDYLAHYWGSEIRADFERRKDDPKVRERYDPREHLKAVEVRAASAVDAATRMAGDIAAGALDPTKPGFHQGNLSSGPARDVVPAAEQPADEAGAEPPVLPATSAIAVNGAEGKGTVHEEALLAAEQEPGPTGKVAPEYCWTSERAASDLALSRELVLKLDAEKDIGENPLLVGDPAAAAGAPPDGTNTDMPDAPPPLDYEQQLGKLDSLLTWLWRVHGVDYYAGVEIAEPDAEQRSGPRPTLRCPRPEEGEQLEEDVQHQQVAILEKNIDEFWRKRIQAGDPFQKLLHQDKLAAHIEAWVGGQIVRHEEKKWGSKVSAKLFMDREYVVKHIHNKHKAVVDKQKDKYWDDVYFQSFKAEREAEQRKRRDTVRAQRDSERATNAASGQDSAAGLRAAVGDTAVGAAVMGGAPFGRAMPGVGMPELAPGMMLVLAEGAGPMGPWIPVPIPSGGSAPMLGGGRPVAGQMRGGPMPGGMMGRGGPHMGINGGGFGGGYLSKRQSDYQDLDDPRNNRTVLDYGDL